MLCGGAFPAGGIDLPAGVKPVSLLVISNVLEHKALEMELAARHAAAHKSFPITFLLPVPTTSCLNPWFLSPSIARGRTGWEFGIISGWYPSVLAHSAEDGQRSDSCRATLICAGVGPKKLKLL